MSILEFSPVTTGWTVGQSIAWELDTALTLVTGTADPDQLPDALGALWRAVPADWRAESSALLGPNRYPISLISEAAPWAGVLHGDDYTRVTLAIRSLTAAQALDAITPAAAARGEVADVTRSQADRLVDLATRLTWRLYQEIGFDLPSESLPVRHERLNVQHVVRILHDGDLHARFWHWLDRFYYEVYRPWRTSRLPALELATQHVLHALGAAHSLDHPPALEWLPTQNPLLRYPELRSAVARTNLHVFFWIEPFGLADHWALLPGTVALSVAEPGDLYAGFTATASHLASRVSALSDPTRLIILRLIRNFGMINTEVADFLQLARPTVSIHAKILRDAGFIRSTQQGRAVRHELVPGELRDLFQELQRFLDLPPEV